MQRTRFSHTHPSFIIIASTRDSSTPSFRLAIDSRFSRRRRRIAAAGYYRFALFPLSDHFLDLAFFFGRSPPSTLCFFRIQKQKAALTPPPKSRIHLSDNRIGALFFFSPLNISAVAAVIVHTARARQARHLIHQLVTSAIFTIDSATLLLLTIMRLDVPSPKPLFPISYT